MLPPSSTRPQQIGDQRPAGADRIHTGMPPEAAVLAGQQRFDQHPWVVTERFVLAVFARISRTEGPVQAVVESHRSPHRRQAAPHGHQHHRKPQQQHSSRGNGGGGGGGDPEQGGQAWLGATLKNQLRQTGLRGGSEPDRISITEQQLADPLPTPVEAIGGAIVAEQPVGTDLLEEGMALADRRMVEPDLQAAVAAQAIETTVQADPAARMARNEELQERFGGQGACRHPSIQQLSAQHRTAPPTGPGRGRPPPR